LIGHHRFQIRIKRRQDLNILRNNPPKHLFHIGHQFIEVKHDRFQDLLAAEGQELTGQRSGTPSSFLYLNELFVNRIVWRDGFQGQNRSSQG